MTSAVIRIFVVLVLIFFVVSFPVKSKRTITDLDDVVTAILEKDHVVIKREADPFNHLNQRKFGSMRPHKSIIRNRQRIRTKSRNKNRRSRSRY